MPEEKELFDKEKTLRKELDQSYQASKEAEQLRDALMHMVVHDLRSPLSGILSNLQLLLLDNASGLNQDQLDTLTTVEKATRQLNRMINSIMDLSKIESGKMHLNLQLINIRMVLDGLLSQYLSLVEDHNLQVEVIFPKDTIWLQGDQGILIRVFENLLFNALKYARTRMKIEVTTEVEGFCVRFSDDDPGIPNEFKGRIFDKYFQVSDQRAQKTRSGFGLGLAFCKMAVETHQGTIKLDTDHDLGTAFIIQLPKLDPETYTDPSMAHKPHALAN
ncbi:MAG TPA: HAMP domain-containing histidine kinase [Verrucomicrobia bacterium]|nr:HAMP domain-containing histidine kinase [Verrucomicrobiota bacterium]